MAKERIFVGLGSNMGDKYWNIKRALEMLGEAPGVTVVAVSSFYRTAPVGYTQQDWFLNAVAELKTVLEPEDLLSRMLHIEKFMGRKRTIHWGPRVVDLDLLLYGEREISVPGLEVPHPRMQERAFVIVPLADIAPGLVLSGGRRVTELAGFLKQQQKIERID